MDGALADESFELRGAEFARSGASAGLAGRGGLHI